MKKIMLLTMLLLLPLANAYAGNMKWRTDIKAASAENRPMLINIYADWCPYCKRMNTTFEDARVAEKLSRYIPVKVNVDQENGKEIAGQVCGTSQIGLPTTVIVSGDGTMLEKITGYRDADELLQILDSVQAK